HQTLPQRRCGSFDKDREITKLRKLAGGLSLADAEAFYDRTDGPNVRRVLEESLPANLTLMMTATGEYRLMD
ncbi:hypothetical protein ACTZFO_25445, partial [Escherichia coli]|nr:hypothetical protein [Escherichia coli]